MPTPFRDAKKSSEGVVTVERLRETEPKAIKHTGRLASNHKKTEPGKEIRKRGVNHKASRVAK